MQLFSSCLVEELICFSKVLARVLKKKKMIILLVTKVCTSLKAIHGARDRPVNLGALCLKAWLLIVFGKPRGFFMCSHEI